MSDNVKAGAQQVDESTAAPTDALPKKIGRYRVERMLGRGGFGTVYLAHDDQLDRRVAVKVPFRQCAAELENAQTYIAEGRVLANLDHPNIVPVHDLGRTEDGLPFIVSKYVEGTTLATKIKEGRLPCIEVIDLVATIAEALHYAHRKGLVHRDIKPGNILLDATGKPFVADFGLTSGKK